MVEQDDFEIQRNFELGQGAGWEDAGKRLMAQATTYFMRGKDDTAMLLRELAKEFTDKGKLLMEKARNTKAQKEGM